jgi:hypothetical protein
MEHLCEPEHDLMDDVDARYIIEGRHGPSDMRDVFLELIDNEDCQIDMSWNFEGKYFHTKIVEDGIEWTEQEIEDFYNVLWENCGEKEIYLERVWR